LEITRIIFFLRNQKVAGQNTRHDANRLDNSPREAHNE